MFKLISFTLFVSAAFVGVNSQGAVSRLPVKIQCDGLTASFDGTVTVETEPGLSTCSKPYASAPYNEVVYRP